ncbi:MAG TPA: glycerol-3-phosphate 1-O-acyltransferase PlsY [Burkholderiales bacterium]|nr:glycerol-3-phosphate 1-O-acyltransferase PlsY [Burkholderiales bacterium]
MAAMLIALATVGAYLLGSVSFAILVSRLMRLPDPRSYGSKNPGATNVLRTGKKVAAVLTLAGDALKGFVAVVLALMYLPEAAPYVGMAAFLGHVFPVYHRFQGGKGVATAAGVLFGFDAWLGLGTISTFAVIAAFFRYVSLASMVAAAFAIFFAWFLKLDAVTIGAVAAMAALLVWRHKDNIKRLIAGTESKLGQKKTTPPDPSAASQ